MQTLRAVNIILIVLLFLCNLYQIAYIPVSFFHRERKHRKEVIHRFAVLIAARNEEKVIGNLIDSINSQTYPSECIDIYVCADNCTDDTERVASERGAAVYVRTNKEQVGKGYALNYLIKQIKLGIGKTYDGYIVLDADNIIEENFVSELNRVFSDGYEVVTSYRNSKNYGDNWISAGYGLWFLREAKFLNEARMALGHSCAVSGTGFLFSERVLNDFGGWNFFLLTEDIEFTIENVTRGRNIGYAKHAVLYDEQPTRFTQSWNQRLRWSRGYIQVFTRYFFRLLGGSFMGSFSCFDMMMNIMSSAVITAVGAITNAVTVIYILATGGTLPSIGVMLLEAAFGIYMSMLALGLLTTVSEWRNIHCTPAKKILYAFTFPFFMLTYVPICVVSLFAKVGWKPILHGRSITLREIKKEAE